MLLLCWLAASSGFDAAFKLRAANEKGAPSKLAEAPAARAHSTVVGVARKCENLCWDCLFMGILQQKSPRTSMRGPEIVGW
jgi:hypothetical protein